MTNRKDADHQTTSPSRPSSGRAQRRRLGRGLSSLISSPVPIDPTGAEARAKDDAAALGHDSMTSDAAHVHPQAAGAEVAEPVEGRGGIEHERIGDALKMVPIDTIQPNRLQPRRHFDEAGIESLATSIRSAGVMQPIILRPTRSNIDAHQYEIVAGERRWRAAKQAGLHRVPAVVRSIDDATAAEWALIENIQREDLNPIERAEAFHRLCEEFSMTHQEIAERVGLDRSSVTNLLRLLDLDADTIDDVRYGRLTLGHARALLSITDIPDRRELSRQVIKRGWSVRELERRIKVTLARNATSKEHAARESPAQIHLRHLAEELSRHLGTRVRIDTGRKKGSGKLMIEFYSLDEFESLLDRLGYKPS